mmetsp:Transcript_14162/g.29018  ORF Transcript_14162/g.29018 Transcript_14162/m.29018 type:complete len:81 (+) Transcript_14162:98-340(+)
MMRSGNPRLLVGLANPGDKRHVWLAQTLLEEEQSNETGTVQTTVTTSITGLRAQEPLMLLLLLQPLLPLFRHGRYSEGCR